MCICVNCSFYQSCWIHKGLFKLSLSLDRKDDKSFKDSLIPIKTRFLEFHFILTFFLLYESSEVDIIECESFCEQAGDWINDN